MGMSIEAVGLRDLTDEFASAGSSMSHKQLDGLETRFRAAFLAVRGKTHVDTGHLRFSGRDTTHYDGDVWSGEMEFAAHPGIFELARGDTPSKSHPEGGHFFFNAVEPFIPSIEDEITTILESYFNGRPL